MALATKCPHCNTIFRVAHDQLKLRGGIVRCGACNEVFDGNAALVDAALKQPAIIDLPAASAPAPTSSPELEALITTLDALAAEAEKRDAEQEQESAPEPEPKLEPEPEPEPEPELAPEPEQEPELAPEPEPASPAPSDGEALDLDLDLDVDIDAEPQATSPALSALDDEVPDSRREPTLDLPPDEHLTAVALHDSFELDAYPARSDAPEDDDAHLVTLSGAAPPAAAASSEAEASSEADAATEEIPGTESDAKPETEALPEAGDSIAASTGPATPVSAGLAGTGADANEDDDEPGFVKRSRRRQQVGKAARVAMGLGIPLLLAALAAQVLGTFRNPLAAAVPALKPALVSACALAGCKVDLPAQIDALSIEQGELQTLADNVFSFTTTLRNGARSAQAWPHIELILNDDAGKPVLRRVFAPREYLANAVNAVNAANAAGQAKPADIAKGFAPRSEQSVKLYFELAQIKASGYHIAVFYP